jgi:hypothetical protein
MSELSREDRYRISKAIGQRGMHPHRLTVYVEGKSDESFFSKYDGEFFYFTSVDGRDEAIDLINKCERVFDDGHHSRQYATALVDLDDNALTGFNFSSEKWITYIDAYDASGFSRDLECMLMRSKVFDLILKAYDIERPADCVNLRNNLAKVCAVIGACYVVKNTFDIETQKDIGTFDGIKFNCFLDIQRMTIFVDDCFDQCFKNVIDVALLSEIRSRFDKVRIESKDNPWSLARGHDLVRVLAMYLSKRKKRIVNVAELERMFRTAHYPEFVSSGVYERLMMIAIK